MLRPIGWMSIQDKVLARGREDPFYVGKGRRRAPRGLRACQARCTGVSVFGDAKMQAVVIGKGHDDAGDSDRPVSEAAMGEPALQQKAPAHNRSALLAEASVGSLCRLNQEPPPTACPFCALHPDGVQTAATVLTLPALSG